MSGECREFDRLLGEEDPQGVAALEAHANECPDCAEELRLHHEIRAAARQLQRRWPTPDLPARTLSALNAARAERQRRGGTLRVLAAAAVLAVLALGVSVLVRRGSDGVPVSPEERQQRLLTEGALRDVERAEGAYVRSIEALRAVAEPRLRQADSPLLLNYREKLELLDAAIGDCRAQIEANRFHAGLRRELLDVYRIQQQTLQEVLKEKLNGES